MQILSIGIQTQNVQVYEDMMTWCIVVEWLVKRAGGREAATDAEIIL